MTQPAKLLFDENIPRCIVQDLPRLLVHAQDEETAHITYIHDVYGQLGLTTQGTWDEQWVPNIAGQGFTVIAGDRGKRPGKGEKLPKLCAQYGITLVMLSPVVHHRKKFRKLLTLLSVWHRLVGIAKDTTTRRFLLEPHLPAPEHCARGKLSERALPSISVPPKGMLFRKR